MLHVSELSDQFDVTLESSKMVKLALKWVTTTSDAAQDRTCTARAVVRSGHRTTARAVKKN